MKNITDYIARTVAFKMEFEKLENMRLENPNTDAIEELKKKQFSAMVAFKDFDDLMTCRAILNIMFPTDKKVARFIDNMINEVNAFVPQKMTDVIDSYIDTVSVVVKEVKKRESWYNEFAENRGLIRFNEFIKNGKAIIQNGNTQSRDSNIVSGSQVNPNFVNEQFVSSIENNEKGLTSISRPSDTELTQAKAELQLIEKQKKQMDYSKRILAEKRSAEYEATLARRIQLQSAENKRAVEASRQITKNPS